MVPPRKKARISPSITTDEHVASSPPKSAPIVEPSTPTPFNLQDPWTPAQETALFKLLIHHKPTGIHKHFHMLSIYNSLQSQGLTHTRPSRSKPEAPIEHMMPARIWDKLRGLYDLGMLDERETAWDLDNTDQGSDAEQSNGETPPSQRNEWIFTKEFSLDETGSAARDPTEMENFTRMMFARRLKTGSDPASSPPLEARSVDTPSVKGVKGRGRPATKGSVRSSARQSTAAVGGRRGSRTTTTTTSTAEEEAEEEDDGEDEGENAEETKGKRSRSTRGTTREATKKSKGRKKKP